MYLIERKASNIAEEEATKLVIEGNSGNRGYLCNRGSSSTVEIKEPDKKTDNEEKKEGSLVGRGERGLREKTCWDKAKEEVEENTKVDTIDGVGAKTTKGETSMVMSQPTEKENNIEPKTLIETNAIEFARMNTSVQKEKGDVEEKSEGTVMKNNEASPQMMLSTRVVETEKKGELIEQTEDDKGTPETHMMNTLILSGGKKRPRKSLRMQVKIAGQYIRVQ